MKANSGLLLLPLLATRGLAVGAGEVDWVLESTAAWQPRDFKDKLLVLGGHARPLSSEVWSLNLPPDWNP